MYPRKNQVKYNLCPRYTIADADKLLVCFGNKGVSELMMENWKFQYIKIDLNKKFKSVGNEIEALYCYIVMDFTSNYKNHPNHPNHQTFEDIITWLKNDVNNHYTLVTTPILKHKDIYYSIANDNNLSVVEHNDIEDDKIVIQTLINNNCFTICDNYNIVISLYQKKYISKKEFIKITKLLEQLKHFYYTPPIWLHYMNKHRILNACDFPILYLTQMPHMIDASIMELYDWVVCGHYHVYMQTYYRQDIIFTTCISHSYPYLNLGFLELILGKNVKDKLLINYTDIVDDSDNVLISPDLFGLLASFAYNNSMWKLWQIHNYHILTNLLTNIYHKNAFHFLTEMLVPLFKIYTDGFELINIKKNRIHQIWKDVLNVANSMNSKSIGAFLECYIISNRIIKIPYIFLLDVFTKYDIDLLKYKQIHININGKNICKYDCLYRILHDNNNHDSLFYFYRNVIKKRMIYILMCIYKKFKMYSKINTNKYDYITGCILVGFLRENKNYLL